MVLASGKSKPPRGQDWTQRLQKHFAHRGQSKLHCDNRDCKEKGQQALDDAELTADQWPLTRTEVVIKLSYFLYNKVAIF